MHLSICFSFAAVPRRFGWTLPFLRLKPSRAKLHAAALRRTHRLGMTRHASRNRKKFVRHIVSLPERRNAPIEPWTNPTFCRFFGHGASCCRYLWRAFGEGLLTGDYRKSRSSVAGRATKGATACQMSSRRVIGRLGVWCTSSAFRPPGPSS